MSILCKWFGHQPVDGYVGRPPYFRVKSSERDGTGVDHWRLHVTCRRCNTSYHIGNVHVFPEDRQK